MAMRPEVKNQALKANNDDGEEERVRVREEERLRVFRWLVINPNHIVGPPIDGSEHYQYFPQECSADLEEIKLLPPKQKLLVIAGNFTSGSMLIVPPEHGDEVMKALKVRKILQQPIIAKLMLEGKITRQIELGLIRLTQNEQRAIGVIEARA